MEYDGKEDMRLLRKIWWDVLVTEKVSEYDQDMPQSRTADQPTTLWGGGKEQ